jgi:hypothetical protein
MPQSYESFRPVGPVIDTNPPEEGTASGTPAASTPTRTIASLGKNIAAGAAVGKAVSSMFASEVATPVVVSATHTGGTAAAGAATQTGTSGAASQTGGLTAAGKALAPFAPYVGAAIGTAMVYQGVKDLISDKKPKGAWGKASRIQTAISSGGLSEIARITGLFGDSDKWKTEGDRINKLRESGVDIPDALAGAAFLTAGRSKEELIRSDLAADFVGKDEEGVWVNNKFADSRNEDDLTAYDKWGYAAFYEMFPDWLQKSEQERFEIANAAKVSEHHGTMDITNKDELTAFAEQLKTGAKEVQQAEATTKMLGSIGITDRPSASVIEAGIDSNGATVYTDPTIAANTNMKAGQPAMQMTGALMNAVGAFTPEDLSSFRTLELRTTDKPYFEELDNLHNNDNVEEFVNKLGSRDLIGHMGYTLYEKWGVLSPAQKSVAVANASVQGYKFSDGKTIHDKMVTPKLPGIPGMTVADSLRLSSAQVNVVPLARDWVNYTAAQEAAGGAKQTAPEIAQSLNAMGMLGFGADGRAVPITEKELSAVGATPTPQYGIGAVSMPMGKPAPSGYVALTNIKGRNIVVPEANADTTMFDNPIVASEAALKVYRNWTKDGIKQDRGVIGGSAFVSGLNKLNVFNPEGLGSAVVYNTLKHVVGKGSIDALPTMLNVMGVNLERLVHGESNPEIDAKGMRYKTVGPLLKGTFEEVAVAMRREYALNNIVNKEQAYQLANQAFAEGRFSAIDVVSAQRAADMVYDDTGYYVASNFSGGVNDGLFLSMKRHATKL